MPIPTSSPYGTPEVANGVRVHASIATLAALLALDALDPAHVDGNEVLVEADHSRWYYHSTSALAADNVLAATPTNAPGRWLRAPGEVELSLPITYATADAAVLLTVPAGARLHIRNAYFEVSTGFTGGSSSAIGVSSNKTGFSTKGDLLGGAAGDVAAALVAGTVPGTIGVGINSIAKAKTAIFEAGDTIRFDRITSAFTAGAGSVRIVAFLSANPGA